MTPTISTEQLAEKLGLTTGRIRQLAIAGRIIGAHKIGRDWQFTEGARIKKADPLPSQGPRKGKR